MKKLKLIALVYGSKDEQIISQWSANHGRSIDLVKCSPYLSVPLQAAVAHFSESYLNEIDGLIIDDYKQYDPIVLSQVHHLLLPYKIALFSASHEFAPVAGCVAASSIPNTVNMQGASQPRILSTVA